MTLKTDAYLAEAEAAQARSATPDAINAIIKLLHETVVVDGGVTHARG